MNQVVKMLLIIFGTICVALGALGVFLPLLPTTPFLLLAVACYAKSSQRLHDWLLNNRWFGEYLKNWREGRGLSLKTKTLSLTLLLVSMSYSIIYVVPALAGKLIMVLIALGVSSHIVFLPTLKMERKLPVQNLEPIKMVGLVAKEVEA